MSLEPKGRRKEILKLVTFTARSPANSSILWGWQIVPHPSYNPYRTLQALKKNTLRNDFKDYHRMPNSSIYTRALQKKKHPYLVKCHSRRVLRKIVLSFSLFSKRNIPNPWWFYFTIDTVFYYSNEKFSNSLHQPNSSTSDKILV